VVVEQALLHGQMSHNHTLPHVYHNPGRQSGGDTHFISLIGFIEFISFISIKTIIFVDKILQSFIIILFIFSKCGWNHK